MSDAQPLSTMSLQALMNKLNVSYTIKLANPGQPVALYQMVPNVPIWTLREGKGWEVFSHAKYGKPNDCLHQFCSDVGWFRYGVGYHRGRLVESRRGIFNWERKRVDLTWTKVNP